MSCIGEAVWMTPSQPSKAARRLALSSRSTCSIVRRSAAPSSAQRCAFLGSSAPPNRDRQPGKRSRQPHSGHKKGFWGTGREQQRVPARREVPRTAYPRSRRSLTIHDPMKPPAPVTHTVTAMGARPGDLPNRKVVAEMRGRRREIKIDPSRNFAHGGARGLAGRSGAGTVNSRKWRRTRAEAAGHVNRESPRPFFYYLDGEEDRPLPPQPPPPVRCRPTV